jgi:hypothetical protein
MALWGNNDAVGSGGTVSLDYTTLVVTGTGTTFGQKYMIFNELNEDNFLLFAMVFKIMKILKAVTKEDFDKDP